MVNSWSKEEAPEVIYGVAVVVEYGLDALAVVDGAIREDELVGRALPGHHLAAEVAEGSEVGIIGRDDPVVLKDRLKEEFDELAVCDVGGVEGRVPAEEVWNPRVRYRERLTGRAAVCSGCGVGEARERGASVQAISEANAGFCVRTFPNLIDYVGNLLGDGDFLTIATDRRSDQLASIEGAGCRVFNDAVDDTIERVAFSDASVDERGQLALAWVEFFFIKDNLRPLLSDDEPGPVEGRRGP